MTTFGGGQADPRSAADGTCQECRAVVGTRWLVTNRRTPGCPRILCRACHCRSWSPVLLAKRRMRRLERLGQLRLPGVTG